MKLKIWNYFFIFLFFSESSLNINSSTSFPKKESIDILNEDYLKKLPENDYILGPGDNLNIIVSRDYPDLNSIQSINGEGTIYLPKLKRIYVAGLTKSELINLLNKAYKEYVKYPSVELIIVNYRPIRIYVKGEVLNPGLQVLEGAITEKPIAKDPFIGEEEDAFIISNYRKSYFPTVFDAIEIAGGTKILKGDVRFIRFRNDGTIDKRKFAFRRNHKRGSYNNPNLRDGDLIIVGNSFLSTSNEVIKEVTAPFAGIFSTYGLIKAISD